MRRKVRFRNGFGHSISGYLQNFGQSDQKAYRIGSRSIPDPIKIQKGKELLADPSKLIKEIAYKLHLDSSLYFSKLFKAKVGLTPAEYRKQVLKKHQF